MASDIAVSGNSKPFWNYIKSKRNGTNTLVSLKVGDKELIDDDSIASSFKSYFSSVFTSEDSGAPNDNFWKNICSEDDLRSRIFGTFVVKFLACLPLLGFSDI